MQVTIELPEDLAPLLGGASASISRAALEALALESLRAGKITVSQARRLLGISSRDEMDGFLKSHGIMIPITLSDIQKDAETANRFRNR